MPVSDQHPDYKDSLPKWQLVSDCSAGSKAVKERKNGKEYLPMPNATDTGKENTERFQAYLKRANFVNFTGHTKKSMVGMVFRKALTCELPTSIDYLKENANGGGLSLEQVIRSVLGETLETGRYGLLVDYPKSEKGQTQEQTQGLQANILSYDAQCVINWRTTVVNGVTKLSMVVLKEPKEELSDDGFSYELVDNYRVLRLINDVYTVEMYNKDEELYDAFEPTKNSGDKWDIIPFVMVGAQNNDIHVDEAPLYDLAEINLAHYRNSADYEESCFLVGQPTPVVAGLTQSWVDDNLKEGLQLGSRGLIPLPDGGSATLLQAEPNQMPLEGMNNKETQMMMIGARIIQDKAGVEASATVKMRLSGQTSELAALVGNITDAFISCFEWTNEFMGGDTDAELEINKEFYDASLDAPQVMALIQLADRGDISQTEMRSNLRKASWIDAEKTDEELDEETDSINLSLTNTASLGTDENGQLLPATDPALIEVLNKLVEANKQEFIPASQTNEPNSIVVEAPIVNVTLPEGLITIPENMVNVSVEAPVVTVEAPQINVEAPEINVGGTVVEKASKVDIEYDDEGNIIRADIE